MPNPVISRRLAPSENFFRCRTENGFYRNFAAIAKYNNLLHDLPLLYKALRKTLVDYHILLCNVFKNHEERCCEFRPIESARLKDFVTFITDYSCLDPKSVERFLGFLCFGQFFELYEDKPLFHLFISQESFAGATFEHTIADGVVAPIFHEILLDNLAICEKLAFLLEYNAMYGEPPEEINMDTMIFDMKTDRKFLRNSLPPTSEMIMEDPKLDHIYGDANHYSMKAPQGYPQKWPGRFPSSMSFTVAMRLVKIYPGELAQILKKCKEEGVTLTCYFAVIQALTLGPIYGTDHHTSALIAVTMRRFLVPEALEEPYKDILAKANYKVLGNFAHMGLPELFPPVRKFSWELVRKVNSDLLQTVKNRRLLHSTRGFTSQADAIDSNETLFTVGIGKSKADSVKISNVGFANFPVYTEGTRQWSIDDLYFAQDMAPTAAEFMLNMVSCPRGGLSIIASYFDDRFRPGEEEFFREFPKRLRLEFLRHAGVTEPEKL